MLKDIISSFLEAKESFTQRHERAIQKTIATLYFAGDAFYVSASAWKSGFLGTVAKATPQWNLLREAYLDRPLPVVASATLLAGCYLMAKGQVAKSYAFSFAANLVLGWDMLSHNEPASAATLPPTMIANVFLLAQKRLRRTFGHNSNFLVRNILGRPMATGGIILTGSFMSLFYTGMSEGNLASVFCATVWGTGAALTAILPEQSDNTNSAPRPPQMPHKKPGRLQKRKARRLRTKGQQRMTLEM
jgi:hypothetical protein